MLLIALKSNIVSKIRILKRMKNTLRNKVEMRRLDLRHLNYFIAVAEERNFSSAAERLYMAQSQVSRIIRHLEDEVLGGVKLFRRLKKRPLEITEAGKAFLEEAYLIVESVEKAINKTIQVDRGEMGSLVIGINSSIVNSYLAQILRAFTCRFQQVNLLLKNLTSHHQIQLLVKKQLDLAFVLLPKEQVLKDNLESMLITEESFKVVLPEIHPLAKKSEIALKELKNANFILPSPSESPLYGQVTSVCLKADFVPNVVHEATSMITILGLVAGGMGVSILPANAESLRRNDVVYRNIAESTMNLKLIAVWQRENLSPVLPYFLETIKDTIPIEPNNYTNITHTEV